GFVSRVRDGKRGFKVVVGGGLGAVPYQAETLSEFTPVEELLPEMQAVARVFARLGEKKNRNRARIKFLVDKLGLEEFRRLVAEERRTLPHDECWTAYLKDLPRTQGAPVRPPAQLGDGPRAEGFDAWFKSNVYLQRQPGYALVSINLPLGDVTSDQARAL